MTPHSVKQQRQATSAKRKSSFPTQVIAKSSGKPVNTLSVPVKVASPATSRAQVPVPAEPAPSSIVFGQTCIDCAQHFESLELRSECDGCGGNRFLTHVDKIAGWVAPPNALISRQGGQGTPDKPKQASGVTRQSKPPIKRQKKPARTKKQGRVKIIARKTHQLAMKV